MPVVAAMLAAGDGPGHGSAPAAWPVQTRTIGAITPNSANRAANRRAITNVPRHGRGELDPAPHRSRRRGDVGRSGSRRRHGLRADRAGAPAGTGGAPGANDGAGRGSAAPPGPSDHHAPRALHTARSRGRDL